MLIKDDFGITMSDEGGKEWIEKNLQIVYISLQNIDNALNGKLKDLAGGATFKMAEYHPPKECPTCTYSGWTSGTTVTFYTIKDNPLVQMNIYHEFGHVLDNSPGLVDVFSGHEGINNPKFLQDGYLSREALIDQSRDMYQHPISIYGDDPLGAQAEHWQTFSPTMSLEI